MTAFTQTRRTELQLPEGVPRGVWDYAQLPNIASEYDETFGQHPLFDIDQRILEKALGPIADKRVVDLGCGTGRALRPLVEQGAVGVAVDLSHQMLCEVSKKMPAHCVRANLVDLRCFADAQFDHALCLFSTLGMIRGRDNRQRLLNNVRRILKPGGTFVLHVHNAWRNLIDAGRIRWLCESVANRCGRNNFEMGDKFFPYRGVPNFYLHTFWPSELRNSILAARLAITKVHRVDPGSRALLPDGASDLRAGGWIIVCHRDPVHEVTIRRVAR